MFVRFRHVGNRQIVDLVANHRVGCKVQGEHIGRLGSVAWLESIAVGDRVAFWGDLSRRFRKIEARRGNIASDQLGKVLIAIHGRIPRPTPAERKEAQIEARGAREQAARLIATVRGQPSRAAATTIGPTGCRA
jgi:hypothetical protein